MFEHCRSKAHSSHMKHVLREANAISEEFTDHTDRETHASEPQSLLALNNLSKSASRCEWPLSLIVLVGIKEHDGN